MFGTAFQKYPDIQWPHGAKAGGNAAHEAQSRLGNQHTIMSQTPHTAVNFVGMHKANQADVAARW